LACATGLATVEAVSENSFLTDVIEKGNYFKNRLEQIAAQYPNLIKEVRGKGLMLGVEVHHSGPEMVEKAINAKLIFNIAGGGTVLRFVPPLIIKKNHIDMSTEILDRIFNELN
jgi:acetylornithine/N-succinyldiaminopimelate aminotransferase